MPYRQTSVFWDWAIHAALLINSLPRKGQQSKHKSEHSISLPWLRERLHPPCLCCSCAARRLWDTTPQAWIHHALIRLSSCVGLARWNVVTENLTCHDTVQSCQSWECTLFSPFPTKILFCFGAASRCLWHHPPQNYFPMKCSGCISPSLTVKKLHSPYLEPWGIWIAHCPTLESLDIFPDPITAHTSTWIYRFARLFITQTPLKSSWALTQFVAPKSFSQKTFGDLLISVS